MIRPPIDLSEIRLRFLSRLEDRLVRLETALADSQSSTVEAVATLQREFHSIAGIGGTYGFHDITATARQGEAILGEAAREGRCLRMHEATLALALVAQINRVRLDATACPS